MKFKEIVANDINIKKRQLIAEEHIERIKDELNERLRSKPDISVFCAGSFGRGDCGAKSDLDLFILSNKKECHEGRLETIELLSNIININKKLNFPEFSKEFSESAVNLRSATPLSDHQQKHHNLLPLPPRIFRTFAKP